MAPSRSTTSIGSTKLGSPKPCARSARPRASTAERLARMGGQDSKPGAGKGVARVVCYGSDGMRLYWELARRAMQRQLAYRTENLAGLVTNIFFGYLRAAVLLAVYQATSSVGGYDAEAAVTYAWITQAMIMLVALWGWWDVELTIRTGDVISDLSKPISYAVFCLKKKIVMKRMRQIEKKRF